MELEAYGHDKISIHALREEGDRCGFIHELVEKISIHALREEGDAAASCELLVVLLFLSTPSARRATVCAVLFEGLMDISIHALREEGDSSFRQ